MKKYILLLLLTPVMAWTAPNGRFGATIVDNTIYDIRTFGAIDGATDSRAAIQAAVDALPAAGGTVLIPGGIWNVTSSVILRSGVNIKGAGASYRGPCQVRIRANNQSAFKIPTTGTQVHNISFSDLEITSDVTDPTTITNRTGVLFEGNVSTQPITLITFDRMVFRNLNRGIYVYDNAASGWMVDGVNFYHTYFVENIIGMEVDAENATDFNIFGATFGQWSGASIGIYAKSMGSLNLQGVSFGCSGGCVGGWAIKADLLKFLVADELFTEGPGAIWANSPNGTGVYDRVWTIRGGKVGAIRFDGSFTADFSGMWFNDNVIFGKYGRDMSVHARGVRFSSGNDFRFENTASCYTYIKTYNEHRYMNCFGDKSPKEVQDYSLVAGKWDNILTYVPRPKGLYRITVYVEGWGGSGSHYYLRLSYADLAGAKTITIADNVALGAAPDYDTYDPIVVFADYSVSSTPVLLQGYATGTDEVHVTATIEAIAPKYSQ